MKFLLLILLKNVNIFNIRNSFLKNNFLGTICSAMSKLDYLAYDLGINCIELMPIQAFLLGHDWGYTTRHFFAFEPSYGSSEDLKQFIDQCHSRGIRVIMDVVFNHSHTECSLNKIDPTYWYYEGLHHPEHPEEAWGPEFNYDYEDEQHGNLKPALKFIGDVIRFWIEEYHIDGFR
jgi:1,4-alpha-glucan branching enzyme